MHGALVGFIELKAPGKGADPRRFKDAHDKAQWQRLQSLPNLLYTDGNELRLWQNGVLACAVVRLQGDIETDGGALLPAPGLQGLFDFFLQWQPIAPRSAKELAEVSARLCRLLRDEVIEALDRKTEALTALAQDWRGRLFLQASDEQFADGYAQAVTFGLLIARARGIPIGTDLHKVAEGLKDSASLIGAALQLLTDNQATRRALRSARWSGCSTRWTGPRSAKARPMPGCTFRKTSWPSTTTPCARRQALTTRRPKWWAPWWRWWTRP